MSKVRPVRIALAVALDGTWCAAGWDDNGHAVSDDVLVDAALECLDWPSGAIVHFVEALAPIPESKTLQGKHA